MVCIVPDLEELCLQNGRWPKFQSITVFQQHQKHSQMVRLRRTRHQEQPRYGMFKAVNPLKLKVGNPLNSKETESPTSFRLSCWRG